MTPNHPPTIYHMINVLTNALSLLAPVVGPLASGLWTQAPGEQQAPYERGGKRREGAGDTDTCYGESVGGMGKGGIWR